MPEDEEVHEDIDDERLENLSRPRNMGESDDEDEESQMGEDLEEFVRIKSFKCR